MVFSGEGDDSDYVQNVCVDDEGESEDSEM